MSDYSTIQQHEPIRVPASWAGEERRFVAQLEEVFDDLYRRFGRLGTKDISDGAITADKIAALNGSLVISSEGSLDVAGGDVSISAGGSLALETEDDAAATINGAPFWHKHNLVFSTMRPDNAQPGLVWVKPNTATTKTGQWTHASLTSRAFMTDYDIQLTGTALGAGASGSYRYQVSIPIYHSSSNANAYNVTVYLGASEGAETINLGALAFTATGWYTKSITSSVWLGNSTAIWVRVHLSNANYMAVNSNKAFTLQCTDSAGAGDGWLGCNVYGFMGVSGARYLYGMGSPCTEFTGGWRANGSNEGGTVTFGETGITMFTPAASNRSARCVSGKPIDVTDYTTIYVRISAANMTTWTGTMGLSSNPNPTGYEVRQVEQYGAQTYAIHVADLTGAYYVGFGPSGHVARSITVDQIWME